MFFGVKISVFEAEFILCMAASLFAFPASFFFFCLLYNCFYGLIGILR